MADTDNSDPELILDHIHSIFKAFIAKDRTTLRATHSEDWTGFMVPSTEIERGLNAYLRNAEKSLESFDGTGYELLDHEIKIIGDLALVYYVARYDCKDKEGKEHSLPLRSIDIYRRDSGHWIQAGSHIAIIPTE